ncbi:Bardet-Biedl syndrome 12 protein isoform X1 [Xyrauchen texanus]|uniref:Bardet-Biedl syndrome 12 protein isoform X1 n=1 Tax=Xyrauchen texanus TaxID=154827 RepID=UPI0022424495|nr:Bardet-Biedl syndrome 12 protein isoform X1 [Xyrauchen texanus]
MCEDTGESVFRLIQTERERHADVADITMSEAGVATVSHRRHIGLQQLEAIAATTHAFLGPNKRLKFVQDEDSGDVVLVSSCSRLLKQMELDNSVGQLLHETVQAQWKIFHSGTGTLVFLAGSWSRVALECLHRGITVSHIKTAMTRGLEVCLEACRQSAVCLEEVSYKQKKPDESSSPPNSEESVGGQDTTTDKDLKVLCMERKLHQNLSISLKHSRHFSLHDRQPENPNSPSRVSKNFDLTRIAQAVSHGCKTSMDLVLNACKLQSTNSTEGGQNRAIEIQKLVTCPVPGLLMEHSCVQHGYVVLLSTDWYVVIQHLQDQTLNIALVNGDLSEKYRHVGYNRPANFIHTTDHPNMTDLSLEERWIENMLKTLLKLSINILLVSGVASIKLKDLCVSYNILVIEGVRTAVLKDFSATTGAVPISYATQLCERCVGRGVKVSRWREISSHHGKNESIAISIVAASTSLVTVVITSSVSAKLQTLEDQFWSCAHRLHQAVTDRKLLPGGGATELLCIHQLHKSRQTGMEIPYEKTVLQLMAEAWMDYISTLMLNSGTVSSKAEAWTAIAGQLRLCKEHDPICAEILWAPLKPQTSTDCVAVMEMETDVVGVYDNMTVKFEAWRRALDLVFLVLQSDTEIITGVNEGENVYNDLMYL